MQIPKLQQSLHKVLRDSKLQVGLIQDCQEVRFNDVFNLFEKFIKQPAAVVDSFDECCVCKNKVGKVVAELMIFGCGHFLHSKCRPPIPRKTSLSSTDVDDLCKRQTFLAFDENDPVPFPIDDCPICHHTRLIQS
uniref:RING-type domain-containing protein n=1 Tax=Panagrolaimus sp. ES5 TaxID=591445 RepID=A0AC34GEU6_9BILA